MFGWIANTVGGWFSAGVSDIIDGLKALFNGIYGFFHSIFTLAGGAWDDFWGFARDFTSALGNMVQSIWNKFTWIIQHLVPWLQHYIEYVYNWANHFIHWVYSTLHSLIEWVYHWADAFIRWLWHWTITNVWDPLKHWVDQIFDWIARVGETMWHYFTHLAEFAELLFWHLVQSLENHAWEAAEHLGEFVLALFVHNLRRILHLMETVLEAIL